MKLAIFFALVVLAAMIGAALAPHVGGILTALFGIAALLSAAGLVWLPLHALSRSKRVAARITLVAVVLAFLSLLSYLGV